MGRISFIDEARSIRAPDIDSSDCLPAERKEIAAEFYLDQVPVFAAAEMERLYQNIFSVPAMVSHRAGRSLPLSTYVARSGTTITTVFLFRKSGGRVEVLNQMIAVGQADVDSFAAQVFNRFSDVSVVAFEAVEATFQRLAFPFQRFACTEDIVLPLPHTAQEYLAGLSTPARQAIRTCSHRIRRAFPSFRYEVFQKEAVQPRHICDIIKLACAEEDERTGNFSGGADETQALLALVRRHGGVAVATVGDRVCAGAIVYRVGTNYFVPLTVHDPGYAGYRLDLLSFYLTVCDCIARGGSECHFPWGRHDHKAMLPGTRRELDRLMVYRPGAPMLRNAGTVLKTAFSGALHRARDWLSDETGRQACGSGRRNGN